MRLLLSFALRNALRNRRRSALTALTVLFGTALLTIGLSWIYGVFSSFMVAATQTSGEVRVVTAAFAAQEALSPLYLNIPQTEPVLQKLNALPGVRAWPRITSGVTASTGGEVLGETFGLVVGAPRDYYEQILHLPEHVSQGQFFSANDEDEALIGLTLADQMKVRVGDEAIFLGQTQDGSMSPVKVKVVGLVDMGNGLFDRQAYLSLTKARWLIDVPDGALEILVFGQGPGRASALAAALEQPLAEAREASGAGEGGLVAQAWSSREPWGSMIGVIKAVMGIIGGVIVFITGLGVLNTMLMSVLERTGEIGVLRALGLRTPGVVFMFVVEALVISAVGGALGVLIGTLPSLYLETHGMDLGSTASNMSASMPVNRVIHADWTPTIAAIAWALALVMALVGSATPALRASRIQPVQAMRSKR